MAKIVEGIALIAGAIVLSIFSAGIGGAVLGGVFASTAAQISAVISVASAVGSLGVSLLASGIARALGFGPSTPFSLREPAAPRQVVYGQCRISGTIIYVSTSQSGVYLNQVVCWATHQVSSIDKIYLDGRMVNPASGQADSNNYYDDNGNQYNFEGCVFIQNNNGSPEGQWFQSLYEADPSWNSNCNLNGVASSYIKCTYSESVFPSDPGIKANIHGAIIFDPRLGTYGDPAAQAYSNNAALCLLDMLLSPLYGLGCQITEIDLDNFIAAANLCDEQVALAAGGTESRYTCNGFFSCDIPAGSIIQSMLTCMAGKLIYIGGQYQLYPGAFYGSGAIYDEASIIGPVKYIAKRKARDLFNAVRSSFICPLYPYSQIGYDQNFKNEGVFGGEWQVFDAPEYAQDALHSYPSDANLIQDNNEKRYLDMSLRFVTSVAQAQRVAKITLLRNRQQASMTLQGNLSFLLSQPQDVIQIYFNALNLTNQYWEIDAMRFSTVDDDSSTDENDNESVKAKKCIVEMDLVATDPSVYLWSPAEELTLQSGASLSLGQTFTVNPPTSLTLESGSDSAVIGLDGIVQPRIHAQWIEPDDVAVLSGGSVEVQLMHVGSGVWQSVGYFGPTISSIFIPGVVCAQTYDVRIRAIRSNGQSSAWAETDSHVVSTTLSNITYEGAGALASLNYVDFSTGEVINKTASNMTYSNSLSVQELMPAESLADQTAGKSLDILSDGVTYARVGSNNLLGGYVTGKSFGSNMLGNPGFEMNTTAASGSSLSLPFNQYSRTLGVAPADEWFIGESQNGTTGNMTSGGFMVACEQGDGNAHSGQCNLLITIPINEEIAAFQSTRVLSTKMPCVGGVGLTWSAWVGWQTSDSPLPAGCQILLRAGVYFYDVNGAYVIEHYQDIVHVGGDVVGLEYTQLSGTVTTPANVSSCSFQCGLFSYGGSAFNPGDSYTCIGRFDDLELTQQFSSSSFLNPQGSIIPNQATVLTYSTTDSSCTFSSTGASMARADGTTLSIPAAAFTFGGLASSTTYYTYWYADAVSGIISYTNSNPPPTTPNSLAALNTGLDGRISIGVISFTTTASTGTTGGGSGGGGGVCPEKSELVDIQGRGHIRADEVRLGEKIRGKSFVSGTDVYRKVIAISSDSNAAWRNIDGHLVTPCDTVFESETWTPAYRVARGTFDPTVSHAVRITVDAAGEPNGSNYYLVAGTELLSHNLFYNPC